MGETPADVSMRQIIDSTEVEGLMSLLQLAIHLYDEEAVETPETPAFRVGLERMLWQLWVVLRETENAETVMQLMVLEREKG